MAKEKDYGCIPDIAVLIVNIVALCVALLSVVTVGVLTSNFIDDQASFFISPIICTPFSLFHVTLWLLVENIYFNKFIL